MVVELPKVKQNFANIVESLTPQPWTMLQFIIWLDLKLAEYKVSGYMVLDQSFGEMPDWLASLNVDQTEGQSSDFASSKESSQHLRAIAGNQTSSRAFHEVGPNVIDDFSIRPNVGDAQRRNPHRGPAIATARSTGVHQRSDSPILIDDADIQHKQYRQNAHQPQHRGADNVRSSPAKRAPGSMQSPVQTQSYADPKRRRVVPSPPVRNQISTPREDVNAPLREFPARNPPATRTSSQNVRSDTKTIDNTQGSYLESRSLRSSNHSTVTSNQAPTTDIIAPSIADRIPVIDTTTISEEHDTKPIDSSVADSADSSQEETGTPAQTSTEAVNPFADLKIVNVAGGDDTSATLELENVGSPPNDPVPTRLYQHEEFQNRNMPSTSTGQSMELEHSSSMHSDTMADESYDNLSQDDTLDDSSASFIGGIQLKSEPEDSTSERNDIIFTEISSEPAAASVSSFMPNNREPYLRYNREMRAEIARYALKFGNSKAMQKFSYRLGVKIPKSTVHNMKKTYLRKLKAKNLK